MDKSTRQEGSVEDLDLLAFESPFEDPLEIFTQW
jgi:hypothetical protein